MIAQAFESVGYPILPEVRRVDADSRREILHIRHHSLYTPRDFDISPFFAIVKPTIETGFDYKQMMWDKTPLRGRQDGLKEGNAMLFEPKSWIFALALLAVPVAAQGQTVAEFYKGKTVNVYIGVGVGGEYDIQARLVARHIGKHIPGNPTVVPQNMTGAGGLRMINYLYNIAPKDGANIGMIANAFPAMQAVGIPGVQFDAAKMQWLGTIAPGVETMAVWHTTGVKSIEDARKREVVAGASARGAITFIYPQMMNEFLGTKFKIVTGYPGGNQINLAMERGEVEARNNTWSSWKATKADWLKDKKITVIAQAGPARARSRCTLGRGCGSHPRGAPAHRARRVRHPAWPAVRDQRSAGRPRRRAARGLRRHHERPGVHCRDQVARLRRRSGAGRDDAEDRGEGAVDAEGRGGQGQRADGIGRSATAAAGWQ